MNDPSSAGRVHAHTKLNKDALLSITCDPTQRLIDLHEAAAALETNELYSLSPKHKLCILATLVEACADTTEISEHMVSELVLKLYIYMYLQPCIYISMSISYTYVVYHFIYLLSFTYIYVSYISYTYHFIYYCFITIYMTIISRKQMLKN